MTHSDALDHACIGSDARERACQFQEAFVMPDNRSAAAILVQDPRAGLHRLTAMTAAMIAAMLLLATAQRAEALSPGSPGAVPLAASHLAGGAIEVRGGG